VIDVLRSRAFWRGPIPRFVALFVVANLLVARWHGELVRQREANLLHAETASSGPKAEVHFDRSTGENASAYWSYIPNATQVPLVALVGMSQTYAINDPKPGDQTISDWLDAGLKPKGVRAFGLAAPNLNNEEALLILLALLNEKKTQPQLYLYGLCFDKFRNVDLRPGYESLLAKNPELQKAWRDTANRFAGRFPQASEKMLRSLEAATARKKVEAATLETRLRDAAEKVSPMVAARTDLNAYVQGEIFLLRNFLFRIKPTSKRPIIESRYRMNRELLEMITDTARNRKVGVAYYVIPLNPLALNPYVPAEYEAFKSWIHDFATARGIPFANLENEVPSEHWGEFMGGPDFKHFRGEGHRITAAAILREFGAVFDRLAKGSVAP
jgi:hypothetical protein